MTSVNIGASIGLWTRFSDCKQGRKEVAAKTRGKVTCSVDSGTLLTCTPGQQKPFLALVIS